MKSTKWQKRYNIALMALGVWWAFSAASRVLVRDVLTVKPIPDGDLTMVVLKYVMIVEIISVVLCVVGVILRLRQVKLAVAFSTILSVAFLFHPILGTAIGVVYLALVRKDDVAWLQSEESPSAA